MPLSFTFFHTSHFCTTCHAQRQCFFFSTNCSYTIYDMGFEWKFSKHISAELSYSSFEKTGNNTKTKKVLSLQSRYYFDGDEWNESHYVGLVLQKFDKQYSRESLLEYFQHRTTVEVDKMGIGIVWGKNMIVYKRLGLDAYCGLMGQIGKEMGMVVYANDITNDRNEIINKKNAVDARPFLGLNLYFALGKMKD